MNNGFGSRPVFSAAWTPAPRRFQSPFKMAESRPVLGQTGFWDDPQLAFAVDLWTALVAGYLGWGLSQRHNNWGTFWYVVAGVAGLKALHDIGRTGRQH